MDSLPPHESPPVIRPRVDHQQTNEKEQEHLEQVTFNLASTYFTLFHRDKGINDLIRAKEIIRDFLKSHPASASERLVELLEVTCWAEKPGNHQNMLQVFEGVYSDGLSFKAKVAVITRIVDSLEALRENKGYGINEKSPYDDEIVRWQNILGDLWKHKTRKN